VSGAAVALRIVLPGAMAAGVPFEVAHPAIARLCWRPNLRVAVWLLRRLLAMRFGAQGAAVGGAAGAHRRAGRGRA
jgi:hypothetical protein